MSNMKIDNISIILTTKNCLPYLQAALKSIDEHATIVNDVIIWNDGSTDGTNEYLDNVQEFNFDVQVLNNNEIGKGLCTATNESFKVAKNEWVFLMHDDMIAGPNFDTNLTSCVKNINSVISNKCIEPGLIPVSKQFIEFNCGGTIDEFDNEKFLTKIKEIQDEKPDCTMDEIGYPILISKTLFENIGGLDEIFNTGPLNDPDFFYRIYIKSKEEGSDINLIRSSDAILYHFSGKATRFRGDDKKKDDSWGLVEESNYKAFIKKWGESPKYQFGSAINTELRKPIDSKELGLVILMKNNIDLLIQNSFDIYSYFFDEIVIIDDMSDNADEMSEILSKYKNVTVYKRSLDNDFGEQRNYAASKLHTKWVFHLDADETFESKLIEFFERNYSYIT